MQISRLAVWRLVIWFLASISFACLLGEFYGVWKMRTFACFILLPSMLVLGWMAVAWRKSDDDQKCTLSTLILEGAAGGLVAAVAYDVFRIPFVMSGYPLFSVFPEFGKMLLGASQPNWLVQTLGWSYHFSNGAALGVMFTMMCGWSSKRVLFWGAVAWAVGVECLLLLTPYRDFFKIRMAFQTFLILTASAHFIFGAMLGWYLARRLKTVAT